MKVNVRKRGAIGIFYWVEFPNVSTKDEWFKKHGEEWELYCFEV